MELKLTTSPCNRHVWMRRVENAKRQATVQAGSNPLEPATAPQSAGTLDSTAAPNTSLYLGVGLGVGGALLIACILVIVQIIRKRAEHKRALAELERGHTIEVARTQDVRCDVPRPISYARTGRLVPAHTKGGWGALGSNEDILEPDPANHPIRKRRSYMKLPKRIKQQGIPLRKLKYLSAIIESPRSRSAHSPTPEVLEIPELPSSKKRKRAATISALTGDAEESQDTLLDAPTSPKLEIVPSFAIRSPGRYGASFVEDSPKAKRSHSVGALIAPAAEDDIFGQTSNHGRPPMHARSISLGAHRAASQPPTGPVPPLPVIEPHSAQDTSVRNGFCLSRMSMSSQESASSSVLVTSPILRGPDEVMPSPSLEQMVADDYSASLKTVSQRQWQNPLIAGPRPIPDTSPTLPTTATAHRHKPSVRSNVARYSTYSQLSRQLSGTSIASSLESERNNRLSIPRLGTADRISIRSVSSINSMKSDADIKKVTAPRKVSRCSTTVSENGSPAERQKHNVLRDISGNACTPSRQASNATQTSSRSSNGNPFQWDSVPMQKPSALKGSPNARKGHRRQNCVRISTLTPQILGPPPSRPTSPSIMHGIEEEPTDFGGENLMGGLPFVSNQSRLSRPPSATVFAPHLRISTLRASLTSTSPVLNSWTTFQEPALPSQPSDSMLSAFASPGTSGTRPVSRQSGQSSNLSILSFPSPSKTTVTAVQRDQPVPEFYFTRPSTEEPSFDFGWEQEKPPSFDINISGSTEMPSSPPLPISKVEEYDPARPMLTISKPGGDREYDPASPAFVNNESESVYSSPLASTVTFSDDTARYSRPASYSEEYQPDSPPCSPKSVPQGFGMFPPSSPEENSGSSTPRVSPSPDERLTSANASTIMARIQCHKAKVDFPGAPILPPPIDDNPPSFPLNTTRDRSVSSATYLQPQRPAPRPPVFSTQTDDIPASLLPGPRAQEQEQPVSSPTPSPNQSRRTSASPTGPRARPARPLAKQIIALRRMNSEMDTTTSHQSRRYIHGLAREPAPLLPWIGSSSCEDPANDDSCNDLFEFDFASSRHTGRGVQEHDGDVRGGAADDYSDSSDLDADPPSALDNVDMSDLERRLEGALAGFDVPVSPPRDEAQRGSSSPTTRLPCEMSERGGEDEDDDDDDDERSSSVWEDGEKFWERTSLSTIPGSTPSDVDKAAGGVRTPRYYAALHGGFGGGRRAHMRSPSMMATPRSLYDAEGFLKT